MKQRTERAPSQRQLRIGELIRHTLARIIEGGEIHQDALQRTPVTVTEVRISPDLRNATAYITPLGGGDPTEVLQALERAKPFIRRRIAGSIKLRMAPQIGFRADDSFDKADHLEGLLRLPEVARDLEKDPEGDDEDGA